MIKNLEKPIYRKIKKEVKHQDIGGKEIRIEKELDVSYFLDKSIGEYTIAESNFVRRRMDLITDELPSKIYYGHVDMLGYFVAEDELE